MITEKKILFNELTRDDITNIVFDRTPRTKVECIQTGKYVGKTTDGLFRKTTIRRGDEFFLTNIYKTKKRVVIACFVRNKDPIVDTYGGKTRHFEHIEIPMVKIENVFSTFTALNFIRAFELDANDSITQVTLKYGTSYSDTAVKIKPPVDDGTAPAPIKPKSPYMNNRDYGTFS